MADEEDIYQWEYRFVTCAAARGLATLVGHAEWRVSSVNDEFVKKGPLTHEYANEIGREGWELTGTAPGPGSMLTLIFKRLLPVS